MSNKEKDKITSFEELFNAIEKLYPEAKLSKAYQDEKWRITALIFENYGTYDSITEENGEFKFSFRSNSIKSKSPQRIYDIIKLIKECEDER